MASTPSRKRIRSRTAPQSPRVADLTTDELRGMIEQLIEQKLVEFSPLQMTSTEKTITSQMRQRAVSAAGRFHSGLSDISSQHDEFLNASYLG